MHGDVVGNIQRVQTVHADEQNMLDRTSFTKFIVGAGGNRQSGCDQSDGQSDCEQSLFQGNLLCWEWGLKTMVPALERSHTVLQAGERLISIW